MGAVGRGARQHDLRIGSDLDLARALAAVRDRHAPRLGIVLGGYQYLHGGGDIAVASRDLDAVLCEGHPIRVRPRRRRLESRRPDRSAVDVAQEDQLSAIVVRRIFLPAGDGNPAPATRPRPGGVHHDRVVPVAEELGVRRARPPGVQPAATRPGQHRQARLACGQLDARRQVVDRPWRLLLQQQLRSTRGGLSVEVPAHHTGEERVRDGHDRHALVVGHVRAHHRNPLAFRESFRREIERLVEPEVAEPADSLECPEIGGRRGRMDHRRESRRVRRDHQIVAQAALEPERRHAEGRVLVGLLQIAHVVRGLGYSPRHVMCRAVIALAAHREAQRPLEQAADGRRHHERRHQVLEHRSRPRQQRSATAHRHRPPAEPEPVARGHVALRDRDEAREARLGGQ